MSICNIDNGDCLDLMKELPDKSVDLFICDLPYGETNCKWDSVIDLEQFWNEFRRLRKSKRTACIHFCSTKFGYTLIKSWEGGYKMDMVWKKRNKTGGLQSRNRPMRNHEMVYFFYEQAPKYNRDKYHKRIVTEKKKEPPKPTSVLEEKPKRKSIKDRKGMMTKSDLYPKENQTSSSFTPPNPSSVVEEKYTKEYMENKQKCVGTGGSEFQGIFTEKNRKEWSKKNGPFKPPNPASVLEEKDQVYSKKGWKHGGQANSKEYRDNMKAKGLELKYEPPNPASVVEEKDPRLNEKGKSAHGWGIEHMDKPRVAHFDPKLPVSILEEKSGGDIYGEKKIDQITRRKEMYKKSGNVNNFEPKNPSSVVEENAESNKVWGYDKPNTFTSCPISKDGTNQNFKPKLPASVVDEPVSMFESTKVFIGKRHHQTEKPQDILEFFLKYWTDEGDVVLDPTMGSGSTGVACKKLNRNFIGYEKDEKIYEVACKRLDK